MGGSVAVTKKNEHWSGYMSTPCSVQTASRTSCFYIKYIFENGYKREVQAVIVITSRRKADLGRNSEGILNFTPLTYIL